MTALSVERKAIMQLLFRGERAMSRPVSIRQRVSAIPTSIAAEYQPTQKNVVLLCDTRHDCAYRDRNRCHPGRKNKPIRVADAVFIAGHGVLPV